MSPQILETSRAREVAEVAVKALQAHDDDMRLLGYSPGEADTRELAALRKAVTLWLGGPAIPERGTTLVLAA